MTDTREHVRQQIRDLYDFEPETWEAIDALGKAEQRIRDRDNVTMQAHIEHTVANLSDRMRAMGYDLPEGLTFEMRP